MHQAKVVWRWLVRNVDVLAFATALLTTVPLMAWWALLARKNILRMDALNEVNLRATVQNLNDLEPQLSALHQHTQRQLTMISGESGLAAVLLMTLALVLLVVARRRSAANVRMERLLQFTTHELKTPLAGVRALLQSLQLNSIPAIDQPRFLSQGLAECNRLEHLAETILAYQRTVSRPSRVAERHDAQALVEEILEHRSNTLGKEGLSWTRGAAAQIYVDKDAFRVVLENLLDNARKYGGGTIELNDQVENARWKLQVKDRGVGFNSQEAETLFDPFSRHSKNGMTKHGSGLGLYLSKQLVTEMNGMLTATSPGPAMGSTFSLELSIAPPTARSHGNV